MSYNSVPPSIIEKIEKFGKTFDQLTKETVKAFLVDSKKSNFKIDRNLDYFIFLNKRNHNSIIKPKNTASESR